MSPFQWMNTFFGLCCSWTLFNKKDTSLSTGNFSTTNGHLLISCDTKLGRRKWKNDHYLLNNKEYIKDASRDEMKLMPHMEPTSASKTFYQHWCISWLCGDYSIETCSREGKLEKTVCWERRSIWEKLPVVDEMYEQELVYRKVVAKVSSGVFLLKIVGVFLMWQ